jgi:cleavage stimulation factor subunit 2
MSVEEKQARSVFVGNIPHGTTEEQLKEYFSDVGTVVQFRIVYDRETGNPKGYGFCEYLDAEMAQSAIRNLNGREYNGRTLRVDKASSQADELRMIHQASGGPPIENPYGDHVPPEKAPEAISRAVASLPPEQMYELMKQMKICIQNNPNEARTMLLNNPQLAYALLQAQVIMKIVDPTVAQALLHRKPEQIAPVMPMGQPQQVLARPPIATTPMVVRPAPVPIMQPVMAAPLMATTPIVSRPLTVSSTPPQPAANDPRFNPSSRVPTTQPSAAPTRPVAPAQTSSPAQIQAADREKAELIMQVLQLRDDQIAMLPPEQRHSILILKEQIAQSAGGLGL